MRKTTVRTLRIALPLAVLVYFFPLATVIFVVMGVADVARHQSLNAGLARKYFTGNGILTWVLSPVNLFFDLISFKNKYVYSLEDFPAKHRAEIERVVAVFDENRDQIIASIRDQMSGENRAMVFYKWYGKKLNTLMPGFDEDFRFIKTIGVSVFNKRKSTSVHFGPLRLTLRVLYNLTPIKNDNIYIQVDGKKYYWHDNPLFIFDDTLQHQSVNEADIERFCVFVDILRPSRFAPIQNLFMKIMQIVFVGFNGIFYKNWTVLK